VNLNHAFHYNYQKNPFVLHIFYNILHDYVAPVLYRRAEWRWPFATCVPSDLLVESKRVDASWCLYGWRAIMPYITDAQNTAVTSLRCIRQETTVCWFLLKPGNSSPKPCGLSAPGWISVCSSFSLLGAHLCQADSLDWVAIQRYLGFLVGHMLFAKTRGPVTLAILQWKRLVGLI
jgi:hypothetical protein